MPIKIGKPASVDLELGGAFSTLKLVQDWFQTRCWIAGGFLRDQVHGKTVKDIDVFVEDITEEFELPPFLQKLQHTTLGSVEEYQEVMKGSINRVYEFKYGDYPLQLVVLRDKLNIDQFPVNISRIAVDHEGQFIADPLHSSKTVYCTHTAHNKHIGRYNDYIVRMIKKYEPPEYEYVFNNSPEIQDDVLMIGENNVLRNYLWSCITGWDFPSSHRSAHVLRVLMGIYGHTTYPLPLSQEEESHLVSRLSEAVSRPELMRSLQPRSQTGSLSSLLAEVISVIRSRQGLRTSPTGNNRSRITLRTSDIISSDSTKQESLTDGRLTTSYQPYSQVNPFLNATVVTTNAQLNQAWERMLQRERARIQSVPSFFTRRVEPDNNF
jgi:hypothetical protein